MIGSPTEKEAALSIDRGERPRTRPPWMFTMLARQQSRAAFPTSRCQVIDGEEVLSEHLSWHGVSSPSIVIPPIESQLPPASRPLHEFP